jgi:hypothetical protein
MSGAEIVAVLGLALKVAQAGTKILSAANDVNQRVQRIDDTLDQYRDRLNDRVQDLERYKAWLEQRATNEQPYSPREQEEVRKAYDDAHRVLHAAIAARSHTEELRDIVAPSGRWTGVSRLFSRQHDTEALLSQGRSLDARLQELDKRLDHLRLYRL